MKISHSQFEQVAKLFAANMRTQRVDKAGATGAAQRADKVELSRESREVQAAYKAIAATPDVRADIVAEIKARLDAGQYNISGREVAQKMLARSLADRLH